MSVKQFVGCVFVGAAASVSFTGMALAQSVAAVAINNTTQGVQAPTLAPAAGISYSQATTGSLLKVYTDGFLFCGNPGAVGNDLIALQTAHEDQSLAPAHAWTFPLATDAASVNYAGNVLNVNRSAAGVQWTSLACNGVGALGDRVSGLTDGIFDSGFDSASATHYSHMINWTPDPQLGFDWNNPDWTEVPINPCVSTQEQPAYVVEDTACAAVTGVRPDSSQDNPNVRAGTMWTNSTESSKFVYVFRADVRVGAQQPEQSPTQISLPVQVNGSLAPNGATPSDAGGVAVTVVDAYDASYLKATGSYCLLSELPQAALPASSTICAGKQTYPLNGALSLSFPIYPPPITTGISSFYIAVVRDLNGVHPSDVTPVVGASVLVDNAALTLTPPGDQFIGDDVVFGFMTNLTDPSGFPWMHED